MNYQEMDLKELQTLLAIKKTGINVSKEYYKLCKEFTHKKVLFKKKRVANATLLSNKMIYLTLQ